MEKRRSLGSRDSASFGRRIPKLNFLELLDECREPVLDALISEYPKLFAPDQPLGSAKTASLSLVPDRFVTARKKPRHT